MNIDATMNVAKLQNRPYCMQNTAFPSFAKRSDAATRQPGDNGLWQPWNRLIRTMGRHRPMPDCYSMRDAASRHDTLIDTDCALLPKNALAHVPHAFHRFECSRWYRTFRRAIHRLLPSQTGYHRLPSARRWPACTARLRWNYRYGTMRACIALSTPQAERT